VLWVCLGCGTRYAADLKACPQCGSTECVADHEQEADVPKITKWGGASHPEDLAAAATLSGLHPGYGEPVTGVEHPADGTFSPPVSSEDGGEVRAAVTVLPPEPAEEPAAGTTAEPEAAPEPAPAEPETVPGPAAEPEPAPAPKAKPAPSLSRAKGDSEGA
jgi:hypothetical protein